MSRNFTLSKVLFLVLVMSFMVVSFWGISQSKVQLTDEQLREIVGGVDPVELTDLGTGWEPKGAPTNNTADITTKLTNAPYKGYVYFSLSGVSDFPGYCMNYGSELDTDPDLKLYSGNQPPTQGITWDGVQDGGNWVKASWTSGLSSPFSFTVKVKAHDYGAYGNLTATLYNSQNDPPTQVGQDTIQIPLDNNNNNIADGWQPPGGQTDGTVNNNQGYVVTADTETGPGSNSNNGDGLVVFEEYRGFMKWSSPTQMTHTRTNPNVKTLFIYCDTAISFNGNNEQGQPGTTDIGYGSAITTLPSTEVIRVHVHPNRKINPKYSGIAEHKDQYHLRALKDPTLNGYWGIALPTRGTPTTTHSCIIYYKKIEADANNQGRPASDFWAQSRNTISHECAHGVNLLDCTATSGHSPPSTACYMRHDTNWFTTPPNQWHTHHNSEYDHYSP